MNLYDAKCGIRRTMDQHGLEDWSFSFDNAKRRFGRCDGTMKKITMSRYLVELNDWDEVRQTALHEIAHALVGPSHGHDRVWLEKARELGHTGERCCSPAHIPESRYVGTCPSCGKEFRRERVSRMGRYSCSSCSSGFDENYIIHFEKRESTS